MEEDQNLGADERYVRAVRALDDEFAKDHRSLVTPLLRARLEAAHSLLEGSASAIADLAMGHPELLNQVNTDYALVSEVRGAISPAEIDQLLFDGKDPTSSQKSARDNPLQAYLLAERRMAEMAGEGAELIELLKLHGFRMGMVSRIANDTRSMIEMGARHPEMAETFVNDMTSSAELSEVAREKAEGLAKSYVDLERETRSVLLAGAYEGDDPDKSHWVITDPKTYDDLRRRRLELTREMMRNPAACVILGDTAEKSGFTDMLVQKMLSDLDEVSAGESHPLPGYEKFEQQITRAKDSGPEGLARFYYDINAALFKAETGGGMEQRHIARLNRASRELAALMKADVSSLGYLFAKHPNVRAKWESDIAANVALFQAKGGKAAESEEVAGQSEEMSGSQEKPEKKKDGQTSVQEPGPEPAEEVGVTGRADRQDGDGAVEKAEEKKTESKTSKAKQKAAREQGPLGVAHGAPDPQAKSIGGFGLNRGKAKKKEPLEHYGDMSSRPPGQLARLVWENEPQRQMHWRDYLEFGRPENEFEDKPVLALPLTKFSSGGAIDQGLSNRRIFTNDRLMESYRGTVHLRNEIMDSREWNSQHGREAHDKLEMARRAMAEEIARRNTRRKTLIDPQDLASDASPFRSDKGRNLPEQYRRDVGGYIERGEVARRARLLSRLGDAGKKIGEKTAEATRRAGVETRNKIGHAVGELLRDAI